MSVNDVPDALPKFHAMAREAGRDPSSIEATVFGSVSDSVDTLKRIAEAGVTRVVPMFPPHKADTVLQMIERRRSDRLLQSSHAALAWRPFWARPLPTLSCQMPERTHRTPQRA
jgi:hypothetical protein